MASTIATTTFSSPVAYPNQALLDRDPRNGYLYALILNSALNWELRRSTDNGGSWGSYLILTRTAVQEMGAIAIDKAGWLHWCYRTNEGSEDRLYYRRVELDDIPAWGLEYLVSADANGGVAGAVWQGMDLFPVRMSNGQYRVCITAGRTVGTKHGIVAMGVSIDSASVVKVNNAIFTGSTRTWTFTGSGKITPSIDVEHNGDAKTAATPNIWISFGRSALYMVKLAWNGTGWNVPSTAQTIRTTLPVAHDYIPGRWDRARFVMATVSPDDTTMVRVYERNQANTQTIIRDTPAHPTGVIKHMAVNYDSSDGDLRVFAIGTSTTVLYYIDWVRGTNTWTAWAQVVATAVIAGLGGGSEWGVRRGSAGNSKHDVYAVHATPTPNTVVHYPQTVSYPPKAPVWTTSGLPYTNGGAADVAASLTLDWVFSDPDPTDVQTAYALSRQIGVAAVQYWRASDSTWQATEQKNLTGTTAVTLTAAQWPGAGGAADAAHTYKVKVWDSADLPSGYSDGMVVIPSAKVNPTVTAPTAAQVIGGDTVTVTWTVAEQTSYRVTLTTSPAGITVHDSGWVDSADTSYAVPYTLPNGTAWTVSLQTRNAERLPSTAQTRAITVDYTEPPAPTLTLTPLPASGIMRVAFTNPAALGAQPAVSSQELWRRVRDRSETGTLASMESGTTGWAGTGGTMTSSATQKHDGALSQRMVPNGATAEVYVGANPTVVIDPTKRYEVRGWIRPDTANKQLRIYLRWLTAAGVFISMSTLTYTTPTAAAWHFLSTVGAPPDTAGRVQHALGEIGTPAAGDAFYVDELSLWEYDDDSGVRVATALSAGAVVDDWGPYAGGTNWEYQAVVRGTNNTTLTGPWTA
jgi:hypothetical protein